MVTQESIMTAAQLAMQQETAEGLALAFSLMAVAVVAMVAGFLLEVWTKDER